MVIFLFRSIVLKAVFFWLILLSELNFLADSNECSMTKIFVRICTKDFAKFSLNRFDFIRHSDYNNKTDQ